MAYRCLHCDARFTTAQPTCPADGARVIRDRRGEILADRYVIQGPIGAGGTGSVVWDALQTGTHRAVAVKILPPGDEDAHVRFARGAWLAARLDHDHIATIHDAGFTAQGESFLAMERLHGEPLSSRLARGPLPVADAVRLLDQALDALSHAHARRVVHCDLKPDNLFLAQGEGPERLCILDFGIARVAHAPLGAVGMTPGPGVDLSDGIAGTPRYMAPEQIRRAPVDGRADLYALGGVAFEMLTGRPPFPGDDPDAVLLAHLETPPPPLPGVPEPLAAWVHRALAKAPEARFESAVAMRVALTAARPEPTVGDPVTPSPSPLPAVTLPGVQVHGGPPSAPAPRPRWPLAAGGALLFALGWAVGRFL